MNLHTHYLLGSKRPSGRQLYKSEIWKSDYRCMISNGMAERGWLSNSKIFIKICSFDVRNYWFLLVTIIYIQYSKTDNSHLFGIINNQTFHISKFDSPWYLGRKVQYSVHGFPKWGTGGSPHHDFVSLHQGLVCPTKFSENNGKNSSLLLKIPSPPH